MFRVFMMMPGPMRRLLPAPSVFVFVIARVFVMVLPAVFNCPCAVATTASEAPNKAITPSRFAEANMVRVSEGD
jgi:hypothetical protein